MSAAPPPQNQAANNELLRLWMQTGDASVFAYIQSGWTTPVSLAVQPQVQQIIRRYSNPSAIVPVATAQTSPVAGNIGAINQTPPANLPTGAGVLPAAMPPPNPAPSGYQQSPTPGNVDPNAALPGVFGAGQKPGAVAASFFNSGNTPPAAYSPPSPGPGANGQGVGGITPTVPGDLPRLAATGTRTTIAQTNPYKTNPPPIPVSAGTNPAAGGTTVNPPAPNSAVAQQGYANAMGGDQNALDLVLGKLLGNYGIDVTRPGLFTGDLVQTVAPYLKTFLRYFGLDNGGQPALDKAKAAADQFGAMLGGGGTFGQIQKYGQGLLPAAQGLLGSARGALASPTAQQGMINDLMGLLTAGNNQISQQANQGQLLGANYDYGQQQLAGGQGGYIDFLKQQAAQGKMPGGDLLAQIIGATAGR